MKITVSFAVLLVAFLPKAAPTGLRGGNLEPLSNTTGVTLPFSGGNETLFDDAMADLMIDTDEEEKEDLELLVQGERKLFDVRCTGVLNDGTARMRYCRNRSIYRDNSNVNRAIILIHGSRLDAHNYSDTTRDIAIEEGGELLLSKTDVIAPQFFERQPSSGTWNGYYIWTKRWKRGDSDINHDRSSFEIIDHIIDELISHRPRLHTIVVAGQSAGGQFVNRYSISRRDASPNGRNMVFWSANPYFYTWLTSERPDPNATCPSYNTYPYGLSSRNNYVGALSVSQLQANAVNRKIYRTVGENDNVVMSDASCSSMTQGNSRRDRWSNHREHMKDVCTSKGIGSGYCNGVVANQLHRLIPGVGHGHRGSWRSAIGREILFGNTDSPGRISNGIYEVRAIHSNKNLDVPRSSRANGKGIIQYIPYGTTNQQFTFTRMSNGYYEIKARHSNKCLDVPRSTHEAVQIVQYTCNRTTNQLWRIDEVNPGQFEIRAMHSDKCLDVTRSSRSNGARVIQHQCFGTTNQRFSLRRRG